MSLKSILVVMSPIFITEKVSQIFCRMVYIWKNAIIVIIYIDEYVIKCIPP